MKSYFKYYVLMLFLLFIIFFSMWILIYENYFVLRELKQFLRILYPYILLLYLIYYFKLNNFNFLKIIYIFKLTIYAGLFAAFSIYFSYFTGYGLNTYGDYSFATSSFFKAQNDITLSLVLTINISMYMFFTQKRHYILYALIILGALALLGTRAGMLGGISILATYILIILFFKKSIIFSKFYKVTMFIILILSLVIFIYYAYELISQYQYMIDKYMKILEQSPRARLEEAGIKIMQDFSITNYLIGKSSVLFGLGVEQYYPSKGVIYPYGKFVEQDILDFLGSYGFILGGLLLLFPLFILIKGIKIFFIRRDIHSFFLLISMVVFIGHSFLAGHAIGSPIVSSFIISTYFMLLYIKEIFKRKY